MGEAEGAEREGVAPVGLAGPEHAPDAYPIRWALTPDQQSWLGELWPVEQRLDPKEHERAIARPPLANIGSKM
jgi:hypothetical protein